MNNNVNNPMGGFDTESPSTPSNKTDSATYEPSNTDFRTPPPAPPSYPRVGSDDYSEPSADGKEAQQIRFLQTVAQETSFIFLFGAAQRGKTVVTSSVVNFLSSVEAQGELVPFKLNKKASVDEGRKLFDQIRRLHAQQRFPERTVLVGDSEPIYVNISFTPDKELDAPELRMTFLEMPGDTLAEVDSPDGVGELPARINAFMRVPGLSPAFILVTSPGKAFDDDQVISSFMDYIRGLDPKFKKSRFLLLLTQWDTYDGKLTPAEFVAANMRLTNTKLQSPSHSIAAFSIGEVDRIDGKPFLKQYEPMYAKGVVNWLYEEFTGKPLYRRSAWRKLIDGFRRFG